MTRGGYSRIILRPAYTLNVTLIDELLSRTGGCHRKGLNASESFQLHASLVWKSSFCMCVRVFLLVISLVRIRNVSL
jgi:hypothetical protein